MTREAASHAVLGAALELERAAREKSNGQRVRDDHDDQRAEECRQRAVHEEVRVKCGSEAGNDHDCYEKEEGQRQTRLEDKA